MTLDELNQKIGDKYPLTSSQYQFVTSYLVHENGMRAVREAGFKHTTPGSQSSAAYRLLKQDKIQKAIAVLKDAGR